jgi:hypothetical protein
LFGRLVFGGIAAKPHGGNNDVAESNEGNNSTTVRAGD